jgi:hypothetical protein
MKQRSQRRCFFAKKHKRKGPTATAASIMSANSTTTCNASPGGVTYLTSLPTTITYLTLPWLGLPTSSSPPRHLSSPGKHLYGPNPPKSSKSSKMPRNRGPTEDPLGIGGRHLSDTNYFIRGLHGQYLVSWGNRRPSQLKSPGQEYLRLLLATNYAKVDGSKKEGKVDLKSGPEKGT